MKESKYPSMDFKPNLFRSNSFSFNSRSYYSFWLLFSSILLLLLMWSLIPMPVHASTAETNMPALADDAGIEPPLNIEIGGGTYRWSTRLVAIPPGNEHGSNGDDESDTRQQTTATTATQSVTTTFAVEESGTSEPTGEPTDEPADDAFAAWNNRDAVTRAEAYPVRLRIPALDVDAHVEQLGERVGGEMATPTHPSNVGWYRYGAIPGENGNMVMAGHLDRVDGSPAVFWELEALANGDIVVVQDSTGTEYHYAVTDEASYPYNNAPIDDIFGFDLVSRLNLITCRGDWDGSRQTYTQRYVVYTKLVKIVEP